MKIDKLELNQKPANSNSEKTHL